MEMELGRKLEILSASAKYDASCASSGSDRGPAKGGLGASVSCGVCHSWSDDGRCISLLKILMTNRCGYDCAYCVNRVSGDTPRAMFTPEEVADLTMNFYIRNYIEGLFLSSAVYRSPDYTMELIYNTLRILRLERRFNGYIHVKAMPGADPALSGKPVCWPSAMCAKSSCPREEPDLLAPRKRRAPSRSHENHAATSWTIRRCPEEARQLHVSSGGSEHADHSGRLAGDRLYRTEAFGGSL
jgi:predicted DNA-binding helix-hairpin-helix protein